MGKELVSTPRINPEKTCFNLEIRPSKIHRYGVYALEYIPANRKVMEYTGERLNRVQAAKRAEGEFTYLFAVDAYWTLDGAVGGSGAEIINHSCEPNLISRVIKGHILYMSLREIQPGEELTIDYNFDTNTGRDVCRCGAKNCRGVMQKVKRRHKPPVGGVGSVNGAGGANGHPAKKK